MARSLTLGHSPDSDDAFMFYGLAKDKIDAEGLKFEHVLRDIQTLNEWAREGKLDTTAISLHAYAYVQDKYALLAHGASVGDQYGPMIVATTPIDPASLEGKRIAIPGKMTTAYLAFLIYMDGRPFEPVNTYFQDIMGKVKSGDVDAGLIIHEGQLTHASEGLHLIVDMGVWWQARTGTPLPLGVNAIRRDLGDDLMRKMSAVMRRSIEYSLSHRDEALEYALTFARDMPRETADKFVGMYVNELTLNLGERGKRGIELLLTEGAQRGIIPPVLQPVTFID
ncbi:MAG: ABC transporter substrate-binding protein [Capsulimonadaceae bacterium]|nr:ABC transporter substrate-binding protein [Capsulimonadaceae bacterium]